MCLSALEVCLLASSPFPRLHHEGKLEVPNLDPTFHSASDPISTSFTSGFQALSISFLPSFLSLPMSPLSAFLFTFGSHGSTLMALPSALLRSSPWKCLGPGDLNQGWSHTRPVSYLQFYISRLLPPFLTSALSLPVSWPCCTHLHSQTSLSSLMPLPRMPFSPTE